MALLKRSRSNPDQPVPDMAPLSRGALVTAMRSDAAPASRREAVQDLAACFAADHELAAWLPHERDPGVLAAILAALVLIGTDDAAAALADVVCTDDTQRRNAANDALRGFGPLALPHIEHLLASPHPERRIMAVGLLETQEDQPARALLHGTLAGDPEVNVGLAAVEVLSLIGEACDETALRGFEARFAGDAFVGFAVQVACRRLSQGDAA